LVPLPVSRVRQLSLVQVRPEVLDNIVVPSPGGILMALGDEDSKVPIRDGQEVAEGDTLAVFKDLQIEKQLIEQETEQRRYEQAFRILQRQLAAASDLSPEARAKIDTQISQALGQARASESMVQTLRSQQDALRIRAPRRGKIMSPPRVDEIGK